MAVLVTEYNTLGAVDLGSNSFHLAIGRVVDDQIYPLDSLKEAVRLGAGITADRTLEPRVQEQAFDALKKFAERLAGMPRDTVRVVGTNALRVARNAASFIARAEETLGFPIEVISGREEARLIYLGVVHSLPLTHHNRLVVDIGGGSTEFIIGNKLRTKAVESLYMGCVSHSARFFPDGRIDKKSMKAAELAAREQVQTLASRFEKTGWREAVGSSGTARSLAEIMRENQLDDRGITAAGLDWLKERLVEAGDLKKVSLPGLREERVPVIAGGAAIMSGVFAELSLKRMTVADGALRQGVLWDLLGRAHKRDIREVTIDQFVRRYHIDGVQAQRVGELARRFLADLDAGKELDRVAPYLDWAAKLHEVGISISQAAYHKHSAYILGNADMPGFSRQEQAWLQSLVLAQRGKLAKMKPALEAEPRLAPLVACLRLAVIFYRSRRKLKLPKMKLERDGKRFRLEIGGAWLDDNTLVALALDDEAHQWSSVGYSFEALRTD